MKHFAESVVPIVEAVNETLYELVCFCCACSEDLFGISNPPIDGFDE